MNQDKDAQFGLQLIELDSMRQGIVESDAHTSFTMQPPTLNRNLSALSIEPTSLGELA
jgi:hypothetical protein